MGSGDWLVVVLLSALFDGIGMLALALSTAFGGTLIIGSILLGFFAMAMSGAASYREAKTNVQNL